MGLVNGSIPSLINGVSQQPDNLRLPTQGVEQINGMSSLMDGLGKRPPSEHVTKISNSNYAYPYVHFIDRDADERYIVMLTKSGISVYGQDGTTYPVLTDIDYGYLSLATFPNVEFKCLTVADTTFILNRNVIAQLSHDTIAARGYEALVWVRAGELKTHYTVAVSGVGGATFETSSTDPSTYQTINIAEQLRSQLVTALGAAFSVSRQDNALYIKRVDGGIFVINVADDQGNQAMSLVTDVVQNFSELPDVAPLGFTTRVLGSLDSGADDYYVRFQSHANKLFGRGTWIETAAPGVKFRANQGTIPHLLIRKQDTDGSLTGAVGGIYFSFETAPLADRVAGDTASCPDPSFYGNAINDLFLHRGRLGLLSKGNLVLSQAGQLFNFWRQTATALLDDDPIDVTVATSNRAINLRHGISYNTDLILFADHSQFTVAASDVLSPKTVSIQAASEYSCHLNTPPVRAANLLYFPFDNGAYSGIREYYVVYYTGQKEARDITQQCGRYITGSITSQVVAPLTDMMFCLTDTARDTVWAYRWFWQGNDKVQSSWSKWTFGANTTVVGIGYLGDQMYLVNVYSDGTYLERIRLDPGYVDAGTSYLTLLDRRVNEQSEGVFTSYDQPTNTTTIRVPYALEPGDTWIVASRASTDARWVPGRVLTQVRHDTASITVAGDARGGFWLGRQYEFRFTFSKPQLRQQTPTGGLDNITEGRLQVKDFSIKYARTGYLRAELTADARDTASYPMTGQTLRAPNLLGLGTVQLRDGVLTFPVMSRNTTISISVINDTHLPSFVTGAEWVGNYWTRAKRI